ncbi:MAG TPA: PAS domain S-box protein [Ignavibacteria bacterium]|nr:PAS domain S-box protein [Ignavibacteria bacterium]
MKISAPFRISIIYAIFGVLWIFFSDTILHSLIEDKSRILEYEIFKGWFFIFITAVLLYYLVKDYSKKRDKLETDFRYAESIWKSIFYSSQDCIFIGDDKINITDCNEKALEVYGYTKSEIINRPLLDLRAVIDEHLKNNYEHIKKIDFKTYETIHKRKDGSFFPVEVNARMFEFNGKEYAVFSIKDISERENQKKVFNQLLERFRSVVDSSPIGKYIVMNGKIEYMNKSGLEILKIGNINDIKGKEIWELFHPDFHEIIRERIKILNENSPVPIILEKMIRKDGIEILAEVMAIPFIQEDMKGALVYFNDVTKQKEAEEEIRKANSKLTSLTQNLMQIREEERLNISREIHDELGQQLTALKMDISFFEKMIESQKNEIGEKLYAEYKSEIKDMLRISEETIKTIRRIATELRPGILEKLGLTDSIKWYADDFEKIFKIKVNQKYESEDLTKRYNEKIEIAIFRILQESLTNVARHSNATEVNIKLIEDEKNLTLEVKDNGTGMEKNEILRDKGIGLTGINERAKLVNGTLEIKSEKNKGTIIKVIIPKVNGNNQ